MMVTLDPLVYWRTKATLAECRFSWLRAQLAAQRAKVELDQQLDTFCRAQGFDPQRPIQFDDETLEVRQDDSPQEPA